MKTLSMSKKGKIEKLLITCSYTTVAVECEFTSVIFNWDVVILLKDSENLSMMKKKC